MKFFLDTADVAEIKTLAASSLVDRVTTSPSSIAPSRIGPPRIARSGRLADRGKSGQSIG